MKYEGPTDTVTSGSPRVELLSQAIDLLPVNVRAYNCLRTAKVTTIQELVQLNEVDLLKIRNLGRVTLKHIADVLSTYGLKLGMQEDIGLASKDGDIDTQNFQPKVQEVIRRKELGWHKLLRKMPVSERSWMILMFRFGYPRRWTLQEISGPLCVTRERIRQLQNKALIAVGKNVDSIRLKLDALQDKLADYSEPITWPNIIRSIQQSVGSDMTNDDARRLLVVVRGLTVRGIAEEEWPKLSFLACMLPPVIKEHSKVQEYLREVRRKTRERTRKWTYRELAVAVLRDAGVPLHWRVIAERCESKGKKGSFSFSSCFNRLQSDRDSFVRVAQGTYGLIEWGIEPVETLNDLIASLFFEDEKCLYYEEVFGRAIWHQHVNSTSIKMTLNLHPRFYRAESGKYGLRAWLPNREDQTLATPRDLVETVESRRRLPTAKKRGYNVGRIVSEDRERLT